MAMTAPIVNDARHGLGSSKDGSDPQKLREIQRALPDSTAAERRRFLSDRKGCTDAAIQKLGAYLSWRDEHCDDDSIHSDSWTYATELALQSNDAVDDKAIKLPCPLFFQDPASSRTTPDGKTKTHLQLFPGRIDTSLADAKTYALAFALYIDHALDRESDETFVLVADVRKGRGWANVSAVAMLPLIQTTSRLMCDLFPLRLDSCVIFPVPTLTTYLFRAIKPFLGTNTRDKIRLVTGPAGRVEDGVPKKLKNHLDQGLIAEFEERRQSYFC